MPLNPIIHERLHRAIYRTVAMPMGKVRYVSDIELLEVWDLTDQSAWGFTATTLGKDLPGVKAILRRMLGVRSMSLPMLGELVGDVDTLGKRSREADAIALRLRSLIALARNEPWRFPVLLTDAELKSWYARFSPIGDKGTGAAQGIGIGSAIGGAMISSAVSSFLGFLGLAVGQSSIYYGGYAAKYREEMRIRGIDPDA